MIVLALIGAFLASGARGDDGTESGFQPPARAIRDATIMVKADQTIEHGTIVIRGGRIEAVGKLDEISIPFDAVTIDGKGLFVYPGFIDAYTNAGVPLDIERSRTGPGRTRNLAENAFAHMPSADRAGMTPEFEVASVLDLSAKEVSARRKLGFTDMVSAPSGGIMTGQSALICLTGLPRREIIMHTPVGLHVAMRPPFEPGPPEDENEGDDADESARHPARPPAYPVSLMGVVAQFRQTMLDANWQRQVRQANPADRPMLPVWAPALEAIKDLEAKNVPLWWEANTRDEIDRALDLANEFHFRLVIVGGREADQVSERLRRTGTPVVLRLDWWDEPKVPSPEEYARRPASERIEPFRVLEDRAAWWRKQREVAGKLAHAGVPFAFATADIRKLETVPTRLRKLTSFGLAPEALLRSLTSDAAAIVGHSDEYGTLERDKKAHLVVFTSRFTDEKTRPRYLYAEGEFFDLDQPVEAPDDLPAAPKRPASPPPEPDDPKPSPGPDETTRMKAASPTGGLPVIGPATELEEDRKPSLHTGGNVLIKDAIILTGGPLGTLPRGSILIHEGKIAAIGPDLTAPGDTTTIEAAGMVAMPGIIDPHSHIAIQGGLNEYSRSIVSEVRVRDVVDSTDPTIYRAAAGGVTTARIFHGSSDTIGGQDAVIKLKQGRPARELIVDDPRRPTGIKFALGENVTRPPGRFPHTRMGVTATIDRALEEARAYRDAWSAYREARQHDEALVPPRRDLRLEALAGLFDGSFRIDVHCYRADEILMLLDLAHRNDIRVRSLHHALEAYKVAPEVAAHGASVATFADWWGYKMEAADAIPFNAALLHEAGVDVCLKSDSPELVRHLNQEAAKLVRYGDMSEKDALATITIAPAREIGLDHRIGSLELGKDGDVAIFDAHPLDSFARCEMALIDGEVYFQRRSGEGKLAPRPGEHLAMPRAPVAARAQELDLSPSPEGAYAIVGATLHPVSSPNFTNGTLVISEGKIAAIGGPDTPIPPGTKTIAAQGLDVWPGLIDAGSLVGAYEIGSLRETQDYADSGRIEPDLRISTAIHPDSTLVPVTRAGGVLSVLVEARGGLISGQGALIRMSGWVPREMVVADPAGLFVTIPPYIHVDPAQRRPGTPDPNRNRKARLESIRDEFLRAREYNRIVDEARARNAAAPAKDPRMEALRAYVRREKPVIFVADQRVDILEALKLARDFNLKAVLSGGLDAWKVAQELKAAEVPVLVGGTLRLPGPVDPYDAPYTNPLRLQEAGVRFAICSRGTGAEVATASRNVPFEAAQAVAYGLSEADALRSVTLSPAEILDVADRIGSLQVGKDADVVITAGHVLQATSVVKGLFLAGKPYPATSKHTELYDRYRERLRQVREGTAPLGLAVEEK